MRAPRRNRSSKAAPAAVLAPSDEEPPAGWRSHLRRAPTFLRLLRRKVGEDGVVQRAAALAFITILALVPLLAAFSFVAAQVVSRYQERVLDFLTSVLPYSEGTIRDQIRLFVGQAESLQSIGFLAFILVGLGAFGTIEETINRIWQVSSRRSLRAKLVSYTLLVFWGPLLIGSFYSALLFLRQRPGFDVLLRESLLFQVLPLLVSVVGLTMLYWQVPFTRVRFLPALAGGITAALLLELLRRGFKVYVATLMQVNYVVYGGFAAAIFFMLSIQLAWVAILLGTEIAFVGQHFRALTKTKGTDTRFREPWLGLASLVTLADGLRAGQPVVDLDRLATSLGAAPEGLREALEPLVAAGLVKEMGEPAGYVLARDPHELTLEQALAAYERPVEEMLAALPQALRDNLGGLITRLRQNRQTTLAGRSIVQLLG